MSEGRIGPSGATLPNALTALRIAFLPPLWLLALLGRPVLLGAGLALAAATDVADGMLARRRGPTHLGSRLDTAADLLLAGSTLAWLALLRPDIYRDHAALFVATAVAGLGAGIIGWLRFRRIADLHLYSAKAADFLAWSTVIALFLGVPIAPGVVAAVLVSALIAALEALFVVSTRTRVDEHIGSILLHRPMK